MKKRSLVTGASRGIGATVATKLAEAGYSVLVNYRNKQSRAEEVAQSIRNLGQRAVLAQADLTDPSQVSSMFRLAEDEFGLADLALPLLPPGGRIVYVTSHLAHFHGSKPVYRGYEPVAASKKAGEEALRERIPDLARRGVSLVVVSGDLIEGTVTPKLLARKRKGLIEARRQTAGTLPTVDEFGTEIVRAALDPMLPNGATVFVGSTEWEGES